ncbi:MAG: 30S ribosomal protein S3 [Chitinophagaceae bacterium]|nr:30S ribosomal protein S3 [Chitinophagaceae bacterium]
MGQKVNPIGLRVGVVRNWDSNWYGGSNFSEKLLEDEKIRNYINKKIYRNGISKIYIERTLKQVILTIRTSKPGTIIGRGGTEVDKMKDEIQKISNKEITINISEIKKPEMDAYLVAQSISLQIEARTPYKKVIKQAIATSMKSSIYGIKIRVSGRLGGAEMARAEQYKEGRIPLQTIRADIDYATSEANTIYGKIGIKVWIFKQEIYSRKKQNNPENEKDLTAKHSYNQNHMNTHEKEPNETHIQKHQKRALDEKYSSTNVKSNEMENKSKKNGSLKRYNKNNNKPLENHKK